jgi:hypothetical protein
LFRPRVFLWIALTIMLLSLFDNCSLLSTYLIDVTLRNDFISVLLLRLLQLALYLALLLRCAPPIFCGVHRLDVLMLLKLVLKISIGYLLRLSR